MTAAPKDNRKAELLANPVEHIDITHSTRARSSTPGAR